MLNSVVAEVSTILNESDQSEWQNVDANVCFIYSGALHILTV